jgi:hypothetical protein
MLAEGQSSYQGAIPEEIKEKRGRSGQRVIHSYPSRKAMRSWTLVLDCGATVGVISLAESIDPAPNF